MIDCDCASWGSKVPDQTCVSPVGSGSGTEVEPGFSSMGSGLAVEWSLSSLGVLNSNRMKMGVKECIYKRILNS